MRILSPTTACFVLAAFQLCQVSTAAQGRILSGQGVGEINIENKHTNNNNNNGLRPADAPLPGMKLEETSTVTIIKQILKDPYIRSPVAVVIDTTPPFLDRAKTLLQAVVSANTSITMVLIPYNSTGE